MNVMSIPKLGRVEFLLRVALVVMTVLSVFAFVHSASAAGNTEIAGEGYFDEYDVCDSASYGADFALILEGDLEGCLYTYVESGQCRPSGTYIERGTEYFVGKYKDGREGTFRTNFTFTAKYDTCTEDVLDGQIFGRCQHPIMTGTGTGAFKGVKGRLDFKDDVDTGIAYYRGHLNF